jgi:hypothetical protein
LQERGQDGSRIEAQRKLLDSPPYPKMLRALHFYPDRHKGNHMLDLAKITTLYNEAAFHAMHTPEMGSTLVGNCTTVHFGMLGRARQLFGQDVQFTIGSITLNGATHFDFTSQEFQSWLNGTLKPTYNLHAWLSLPHLGNDIIDLTLAATLNHAAHGTLRKTVTFLTATEAATHGIKHKNFASGDDLLIKLNLVRHVHGDSAGY